MHSSEVYELSIMKTLVCLVSLFFIAGYELLGAEAKGLLLYSEPPVSYMEACQYSSIVPGPARAPFVLQWGRLIAQAET